MRMKVTLVSSLKICEQGEITKFNLASATEESARESAEGAVQEKAYKGYLPNPYQS